jgi:chromosome partitioning protein
MTVLAITNQKGGVGKSSTSWNLAGAFAALGEKALLVDFDSQSSLTQGAYGSAAAAEIPPHLTVAALFDRMIPDPAELIRTTDVPGVDLIPGSAELGRFNVSDPAHADATWRQALDFFLALPGGRDRYDWIIIDTPPNLHLCTWAALAAADGFLVPLQPEDYSSQGVGPVLAFAEEARGENPDLRCLGLLLGKVDARTALHKMYQANLREEYGDLVLDATVPQRIEYAEAITHRTAIHRYAPKGKGAAAIAAVAAEVKARMGALVLAKGGAA